MLGNIPWLTLFFLGGGSWIVRAIWPAINKRRRRKHKSPPPPIKTRLFSGTNFKGKRGVARHKNAPPPPLSTMCRCWKKGKEKSPFRGGIREGHERRYYPPRSPVFADKKVLFVYTPPFPSASIQKVPFICGKKIRETFTLYIKSQNYFCRPWNGLSAQKAADAKYKLGESHAVPFLLRPTNCSQFNPFRPAHTYIHTD